MASSVDQAYSERAACIVGLARMALKAGFKAGIGIDRKFDDDWSTVVYVDTPNGQVSWHIHKRDHKLLKGLPIYLGEWDGTYRGKTKDWCVWKV
jgi:hypothetical protein